MELILKDKIFYLEGQPSVDKIIETINTMLSDNHYFSHFIADGVAVYGGHENFLSEHIMDINRLEIESKTIREFVIDLLNTSRTYLKRAIQELPHLADGFYNNPSSKEWDGFEALVDGIDWLSEMIIQIERSKEKPGNWKEYNEISVLMNTEIKNLHSAVENGDSVLIADIIQYEFLSIFKDLQTTIENTTNLEGYTHDIN
ncbi:MULTISPECIES: hypothetical protein [unclassified Mesobacillus]|uniref:hypothetical protein n=1 Tax=unclassified Mesobacillus TaxID=2675270 RepID=UPI00203E0CBD|nr:MULTISPECIES: hypothetical protein [unclassified Mesobacillus]MCM3124127.1 hypothetical protein [Mesobacillus sp. MER 33]MCM3233976.1 hypothetical protein [Mesobacillus sp. MER 48]